MDFVKKAASSALNKNKEGTSSNNDINSQNTEQQSTNQAVAERDYLDKGIGFVSKKSGHELNRDTEEKVGDGMRNAYEKYSGNKVPAKFSN